MTETKAKPEFRFNLSAFLSAARSVTIYLQKQYTGQPEFDEWYEEKQQEMRDSSLFEAMKEARNHTLKESYPRIQELYVETTSIDEISEISIRASGINSGDILRESAPHIDIPGDDVEIQKVGVLSNILDEEYNRKPLCEICREYLEELDILLSEWEVQSD
ncbi:hypothetical protein [Natrinema versiforme]|nr:hypothetical protein [Natrinema versiforme]